MRYRAILAALLAPLLAAWGSATSSYTMDGAAPIASGVFRTWHIFGYYQTDPLDLLFVERAEAKDGKLRVCATAVYAVTSATGTDLPRLFYDANSYMEIKRPGETSGVRVNLQFMQLVGLRNPNGKQPLDMGHLDPSALLPVSTQCIQTATDWDDAYLQAAIVYHLQTTTHKSRYTTIYTGGLTYHRK